MKGTLIGWTAAGLAGVGVFAGLATTASAATTGTATGSGPHQKVAHRVEHRLLAGATRGEVVLDTKKGVQTVEFQRGTTSDASSTAITITDKTGTAQTWAISSTTKVRERGVSSPQLADDQNVVVVGVKSDGTLTARLIVIVPAKASAPTSDQSTA
jgi:hypothetical protein